MALTTVDDIKALSEQTWTNAQTARADLLLAGVLGWITRNAPCLDDPAVAPEVAAEAKMIVSEAILRAIGAKTDNVGSESIGPSSVNYIDRSALPKLTRGDQAALIALCPAGRKRRKYGTIRTQPGYLPGSRT